LVDPDYTVTPAANWWFIITSTVLLATAIALITEFLTERRLPPAEGVAEEDAGVDADAERRGLRGAGMVTAVLLLLILAGLVPEQGVLRNPVTGGIFDSPFIQGIVVIITLWAAICGIVYGRIVGRFKGSSDVITGMESTMAT